jgi:glycerol uptake facilitator protein
LGVFFVYNKPQKLLVEFIGTFLLILFSAGSICADRFLRSSGQPGIGLLGTALAYGLTMAILMTTLGHISGGHFNPAITIGFWVTRRHTTFEALAYWVAQLGGAICAAYALRRLPFDVWTAAQLGAPDLASGITRTSGILLEAIMTFFLVLCVFAANSNPRGAYSNIAGIAAGLTVTVGVLFGGPFTGAALNPARAFGPAVAGSHWTNHGVYWIGPLAGGVAAAWLYDTLFPARYETEK